MTDTNKQANTLSRRLPLILIFLIPVVVILSSTVLYYLADSKMIALGEANRGELIVPPLQLSGIKLFDAAGGEIDYSQPEPRWTLMKVGGASCRAKCERVLFVTGQTYKLLGKRINQVQRFYVSTEGPLSDTTRQLVAEQHRGLRVAFAQRTDIEKLLSDVAVDPLDDSVFFLVDPRGWVMMYYVLPDDSQQTLSQLSKDIIKDIKRLIP